MGGVLQVVFRTGGDIVHLEHLDQKLWGALACPTKGVEFDERTLDLLDNDRDGRIRAPEVVQVTRWIGEVLINPDDLLKSSDSVPLSQINDSTPAGAALLTSIRRVLNRAGKSDATAITLADVTTLATAFATSRFNGDGVLPPGSAGDEAIKKAIEDIISSHGGVPDRGGAPGLTQQKVDAFFTESAALIAWHEKSTLDSSILPLGDKTAAAADALAAIRTKVNDYFARTQLASFDHRSTSILNRAESDLVALAGKDLTTHSFEIAQLPLARIEASRPLPLNEGLNPAWNSAVSNFVTHTVTPILGAALNSLSEDDWHALQSKLAAYEAWIAARPATPADKLPLPRLRELLDSDMRDKLTALIKEEAAESITNDDIRAAERFLRIHRDLLRFLNNFVAFSDFYSRRGAMFQAGTLYLDSRSCDLCVYVSDPARHALLAGLSKAFLAYCDCTRVGGKKMTIAAAFTAGDSDNLMVGRNGVFYDRQGLDWDATITKVIDNPISIRQAFWSPYKKFIRMIEEQVAKRAAAADAASQAKLGTAATSIANVDLSKPPGAPAAPAPATAPPQQKKVDVGAVAAIGVALGSLATFLGLMFAKVIDLGWWAPMAIVAIVLAISIPSMLIAWLKLRQRNLGPILDANGWAVNSRMKINVPFGGALSKRAKLPRNAQVQLDDPFYESHAGRYSVIALIILVLILGAVWRIGLLDRFLPASLKRRPTPVLVVPDNRSTIPESTPVLIEPAPVPEPAR